MKCWQTDVEVSVGGFDLVSQAFIHNTNECQCVYFPFLCTHHRPGDLTQKCAFLLQHSNIDLLNFVFLRDCPSLASQSSNFHITCGTFPAFLCFPASFEIRNANSTYRYYYTRFVHTIRYYTLLGHMHAQLRSVRLYIAQRRKVAPCGAVRCGAVPFAAVLCRCAVCFLSKIKQYRAQCVLCTEYYFSSFFFSYIYILIFHGPLFFPPRKLPPYCRSDTGNKSTQHS